MKVDTLRPELKLKIQEWISSFYHLDPRYKILTFFNLVATEGADNLIDDSIDDYPTTPIMTPMNITMQRASNQHSNTVTAISEQHISNIQYSQSSPNIPAVRSNSIKSISSDEAHTGAGGAPPMSDRGALLLESRPSARNISPWMLDLLGKIFNATSILTVWRPCSNDAMRKMMEGTGVGKGLDIKGKSAKKGILSAFVPFLQIFKQDHMNEIQPIAVGANMRVYYKDEKMRDYVLTVLEDFLVNGPKKCMWKKKKKKTKSIVGTSTTTTTTTTATTIKECCTTEEVEFVDMIEGNNDLSQSNKKALEDAAADIFGGEHTEEAAAAAAGAVTATTKEAIAYMAEDVNVNHNNPDHQEQQERDRRSSGIHSTRFYEKYNLSSSTHSSTRLSPQQQEEAAGTGNENAHHAVTCATHGDHCDNPTIQSYQSGAVRASTSGEERVEAAMIAAEQAVAFADREAATAAKRLSSGTSTLKAEAVVASAKIKATKLKEEAVAAAAKVVANVAAAAKQAHTAAAYENPFGADADDCGQQTDEKEDQKKEGDDADANNADTVDDSDSDSECDGDGDDDVGNIYVGNFDHKDQNSPRYCPVKPLKKIRKFAKTGYYGIECSQRLFWFATVQDANIERKGTGTETGRPSLPGFQDANMKTLKAATAQIPKPCPMPVLVQHHSYEDCLNVNKSSHTTTENDDGDGIVHHTAKNYNPLQEALDPIYLLMAYEEQGTVKPVVSDFDGFLLGWRREALTFGCNLPREQEKLMMWCVDHIEEVLEGQRQNPTNGDTWTVRWLDILKKEAARGFHVEMPEYGFGDPKSTSIMEHAANRMKSTGAVRHGSECFNYQFPQEMDDMFLLISDTLKPVPFKYVAAEELQEILRKKIQEGFVFPLNPKWILCDPGWKTVYDELMATDSLYSDLSKDVWFPEYTGIRERLEEICQKYPEGFSRCTDTSKATCGSDKSPTDALRDSGLGSALTGNAAADLAQMELDDFTMEIKDKKLRASTRPGGATAHMAKLSMTMEDLKESPEEEEKIYIDSNGSIKNSTASNASSTTTSTSKKKINWSESIRHSNHGGGGGGGGNGGRRQTKRRGSGVSQHSQNSSVSSSGTINTLSNTTKDATLPAEATCNTTPKGIRRVFESTRKLFHRAQNHHKNTSASSNPGSRRRKSSEERRSSKASSRKPHTIHGGDVIIDLAGVSSAPSLSSAEIGNTSRSTRNHHFSLNHHKKEKGSKK